MSLVWWWAQSNPIKMLVPKTLRTAAALQAGCVSDWGWKGKVKAKDWMDQNKFHNCCDPTRFPAHVPSLSLSPTVYLHCWLLLTASFSGESHGSRFAWRLCSNRIGMEWKHIPRISRSSRRDECSTKATLESSVLLAAATADARDMLATFILHIFQPTTAPDTERVQKPIKERFSSFADLLFPRQLREPPLPAAPVTQLPFQWSGTGI